MFDTIKEAHKNVLDAIVEEHDGDKSETLQQDFNTAVSEAETAHQKALDDQAAEMQKKVDALENEVTELKDQVVELENDVKLANEATENSIQTIKDLNDEKDALDVKVGELEADVDAKEAANKKLAEKTGEKHEEVNADPNKKIVEAEKLNQKELWNRALEKASNQN